MQVNLLLILTKIGEKGQTEKEFLKEANVHNKALYRLRAGEGIRLKTAHKLATAIGVKLGDLLLKSEFKTNAN